jgi:hypothetical protein
MSEAKQPTSARTCAQLSLPLSASGAVKLDDKSRKVVVEALAKLLLEAASQSSEVGNEQA